MAGITPTSQPLIPRILVVDDDPDLLEGLATWLESFEFEVHTAIDGHEAISLLRRQQVDVVVTDLKMPRLGGLQLLELIKDLDPTLEVIFLSGQGTMEDAIQALREGQAFDFLKKPLEDLQLLNLAIERALTRKHRLAVEALAPVEPRTFEDERLGRLSEREREILQLILQGLQHKEIADRIGLSEKTVRNYLSLMYEKLEVANLPQAILYCLRTGAFTV